MSFSSYFATPDWVEMCTSARTVHTQTYDQVPAMNWDHPVSWGRGSGLAVAIALGSGWLTEQNHIYEETKTETPPPNPLKILWHDQ